MTSELIQLAILFFSFGIVIPTAFVLWILNENEDAVK